jgi:hypothetical protein
MILRDRFPVVHRTPIRPAGYFVDVNIPFLLTPDDVFEIKLFSMVHDPFGHFSTRFGSYLERGQNLDTGCAEKNDELYPGFARAHQINGHAAAMIASFGVFGLALATPLTLDFAGVAWVGLDDLLRPIDCFRLARSNRWKTRLGEGTSVVPGVPGPFGNTTFEARRTGTLIV